NLYLIWENFEKTERTGSLSATAPKPPRASAAPKPPRASAAPKPPRASAAPKPPRASAARPEHPGAPREHGAAESRPAVGRAAVILAGMHSSKAVLQNLPQTPHQNTPVHKESYTELNPRCWIPTCRVKWTCDRKPCLLSVAELCTKQLQFR
uniref:Uncharacterized protein n=1 Tax=Nothoprocta perdicaria TaxID=30464 RepID=A0A8C6YYA0_NOTPE